MEDRGRLHVTPKVIHFVAPFVTDRTAILCLKNIGQVPICVKAKVNTQCITVTNAVVLIDVQQEKMMKVHYDPEKQAEMKGKRIMLQLCYAGVRTVVTDPKLVWNEVRDYKYIIIPIRLIGDLPSPATKPSFDNEQKSDDESSEDSAADAVEQTEKVGIGRKDGEKGNQENKAGRKTPDYKKDALKKTNKEKSEKHREGGKGGRPAAALEKKGKDHGQAETKSPVVGERRTKTGEAAKKERMKLNLEHVGRIVNIGGNDYILPHLPDGRTSPDDLPGPSRTRAESDGPHAISGKGKKEHRQRAKSEKKSRRRGGNTDRKGHHKRSKSRQKRNN